MKPPWLRPTFVGLMAVGCASPVWAGEAVLELRVDWRDAGASGRSRTPFFSPP
jgi:hypothetical protein